MARDAKKRQKALQRKAAKRKQKKVQLKRIVQVGARALLRQAGHWPIHEILITEDWDAEGNLVQILVARQSEQGQIVVGVFLVDLACLGVKNAYARPISSYQEYQELRQGMTENQSMLPTHDLNLVAKIIEEGIAYAHQFGFKPNPDYHKAKLVLGDANPDACSTQIPLGGSEGKPMFISGPYDNVDRIIAKLTKAVGPDGFHYLVGLDPEAELFLDEEV